MDKEIIVSIKEKHFDSMEGVIITTNKQEIKLGICNYQQCCEDSGYFLSEDDVKDFLNTELLSIVATDTLLENTRIDLREQVEDLHQDDVIFINLETSEGTLQFVAYNDHNGYYGHSVVISSAQLNLNTHL